MLSNYFTPNQDFVETPFIKNILDRLMLYLHAGISVHIRGPAGTGKTTLALQLVKLLQQPAVVIFGSDQVDIADLVGGEAGYRRRTVVDNYNRRVELHEEQLQKQWFDGRIATACKNGYTLLYDEYTRSKPEINNVLLPVLEERVIEIPGEEGRQFKVHPSFKAIFTSNPTEYVGVYKSQDALLDRMVTVNLDSFDYDTEVLITEAKSGLSYEDARKIVDIVSAFRKSTGLNVRPTIRGNIIIGKVVKENNLSLSADNKLLIDLCCDVLLMKNEVDA
ncbi:MAG: gas vesicle protein GvpN [Bacillota bacterium]